MEAINSMSINSCEAAQSLVNGMVGKIDNAAQKGCSSLSAYLNLSSDRVEGIGKCSDPIERKNTADAVRADPDLKSKTPLNIVSGNLMARVLDKAYPWMSASEKKLLISMTGTLIINNIDPTDASKATLFHVEASITDAKDIVAGIQGSATSDKVIVPILDCIDPDSVVCDKAVPTEIVSLKHMVDLRMTEYQQRMAQGDTNWAADQKSEMMNFVNIATVPVLRMLKTEVAHEIGMRHNFIELIATQYAIYWLSNMVRLASNAVSSYPSLGPEEADKMEKIHANLVSLKAKLDAQHNEAAKAAASLAQLAEQLERFDKTLRMNDTDLAKAVQLSRSLSAGGSGAAGFYGAH
jgi:conjugative transfer pilus assembly protein TraH